MEFWAAAGLTASYYLYTLGNDIGTLTDGRADYDDHVPEWRCINGLIGEAIWATGAALGRPLVQHEVPGKWGH